jgi:hypothetical protein
VPDSGGSHAAPGERARAATEHQAGTQPSFVDVHEQAGLNVPHFNAAEGQFRLVETMGSGVGLIDYDGDGWLDIYVAQGAPLPHVDGRWRDSARLYRNRRDGTFEDVTRAAGVGFSGFGQGIAVGDYDGDGHDDLYIAAMGSTGALYHNNGDGTFTNATAESGVIDAGWPSSCAFADLDNDGDLDLYIVHYLANTIDAQGRPTANCNATPGNLGYCPPGVFQPEPDVIFRNDGNGRFTRLGPDGTPPPSGRLKSEPTETPEVQVQEGRSEPAGSAVAPAAGNGLGLAILDFDDDGLADVFVANDQTPNLLLRNRGGLRFEDVALQWGVALNEAGQLRAGMGVACGDHDGDGRPDLLVTNFYEEGDTLYRNVSPGDFQVTTGRAGLLAPSRGMLGFGTGFLDYDNDGDLDLFVANGHINDVRPLGMPYAMTPQLFRNQGDGRYTDVSAEAGPYFRDAWLGRGASFGDLDNDGDLDIVVTHIGRPPALLRNETANQGHVLSLSLVASGTGRMCVGAKVIAEIGGRTIVRQVAGGTSYLSASDPRILLGLGEATHVDRLTVRWPSGHSQTWSNLEGGRILEIQEASDAIREPTSTTRPASNSPSNHDAGTGTSQGTP